MSIDLIILFLFYTFILSIFAIYRKNIRWISGIPTLSTDRVLKYIHEFAGKYTRYLKLLEALFILFSIFLIIEVHYFLLKGVFELIVYGDTLYRFVPLLPGIKIPTVPFYIPALYGILGIFIAAFVHEASHAIIAAKHKIKLKSMGIYLLGPLLGAFVEIDDNDLNKKDVVAKISVSAAGPASNFMIFLLMLLLANYIVYPIYSSTYEVKGIVVDRVLNNSSVKGILEKGDIVYAIDNKTIGSIYDVPKILREFSPGDNVTLITNKGNFTIKLLSHPENRSLPFIGISFHLNIKPKPGKETYYETLSRLYDLLKWIGIINYGIGLANCLFLGPLDGGKILYFLLESKIKNKVRRDKIFGLISLIILLLLIFNLAFPFLSSLL